MAANHLLIPHWKQLLSVYSFYYTTIQRKWREKRIKIKAHTVAHHCTVNKKTPYPANSPYHFPLPTKSQHLAKAPSHFNLAHFGNHLLIPHWKQLLSVYSFYYTTIRWSFCKRERCFPMIPSQIITKFLTESVLQVIKEGIGAHGWPEASAR